MPAGMHDEVGAAVGTRGVAVVGVSVAGADVTGAAVAGAAVAGDGVCGAVVTPAHGTPHRSGQVATSEGALLHWTAEKLTQTAGSYPRGHEGASVGDADVGWSVGTAEGASVGSFVGKPDGKFVGIADGADVGAAEGVAVGAIEGAGDVGAPVGATDGGDVHTLHVAGQASRARAPASVSLQYCVYITQNAWS